MVVHVRYDGQSVDLPLRNMDLGTQSTDRDIRREVAKHLNEAPSRFDSHVVDRNVKTGDVTVRPQAVFG